MSIVTGNVKFGVNYPVYVTTTPYNFPAYEYNYIISNLSTNSTINLPPVSSVPNGWVFTIKNNGTGTVNLVANGTDLINSLNSTSNNMNLNPSTIYEFISQYTIDGNFWNPISYL